MSPVDNHDAWNTANEARKTIAMALAAAYAHGNFAEAASLAVRYRAAEETMNRLDRELREQ